MILLLPASVNPGGSSSRGNKRLPPRGVLEITVKVPGLRGRVMAVLLVYLKPGTLEASNHLDKSAFFLYFKILIVIFRMTK